MKTKSTRKLILDESFPAALVTGKCVSGGDKRSGGRPAGIWLRGAPETLRLGSTRTQEIPSRGRADWRARRLSRRLSLPAPSPMLARRDRVSVGGPSRAAPAPQGRGGHGRSRSAGGVGGGESPGHRAGGAVDEAEMTPGQRGAAGLTPRPGTSCSLPAETRSES